MFSVTNVLPVIIFCTENIPFYALNSFFYYVTAGLYIVNSTKVDRDWRLLVGN